MIYPNAAKDRETAAFPYVELFRDFADARMLIFGGAMVAMMIFRPQGFF